MPSRPKPNDPQPGIDYYVEQGRYVFTAAYLAKRGFCCGNACRHCPYEGKAKCERPASVVGRSD